MDNLHLYIILGIGAIALIAGFVCKTMFEKWRFFITLVVGLIVTGCIGFVLFSVFSNL